MNPYLLVGLAVVAVAAVALFARTAMKKREALKKAALRIEWGDHKGAAKLFEDAGELLSAAHSYAKGGETSRAVALFLRCKEPELASNAAATATGEEARKSIALLAQSGTASSPEQLRKFAASARSSGNNALASELLEKAGDGAAAREARLDSARALAAAGKQSEAADAFEREGELKLAAASLVEVIQKQTDPARRRPLAERASKLLVKVGERGAAAQVLAAGGDREGAVQLILSEKDLPGAGNLLLWHRQHDRAAELFEKAGDLKGAARAIALGGNLRKASALLERAGDAVGAAKLLLDAKDPAAAAQVHVRAGAIAAGAQILAAAGDVKGAVALYLKAGDLDNAVELLIKVGKPREAAALLQSKGDHHRAALLLAESGDLTLKAQLAEGKGDFEGAAQAYLDLGQPHDARDCLLHVHSLTPTGRFLLARACMATGDHEGAAQNFSALIDAPPPGLKKVDVFYGLGRSFEELGRGREAIASFEEVVAAEPAYRDAPFRLKLLKARFPEAQKPVAAPAEARPATWVPAAPAAPEVALPSEWGGGALPSATDALNDWASAALSEVPPAHDAAPAPIPLSEAPRTATVKSDTGVPSRYAVESELGRGGMGVVYRAVDTQLGRTVAIKVLGRHAGADPRLREYFLREARAVAQLAHPNIVTLFDAGLEGTSPYLVMELVEGHDLRARLEKGAIPLGETLGIVAAVASALDYAHHRKIIHRDVKPENILVGVNEGVPKLMDFGVAHFIKENSDKRATIVGTPVYMSPEQIKGEPVGSWTDTYCLGVVLYECLTGSVPFDPAGALWHHVNTAIPDPRTLRPDLPASLAELVVSCLGKTPQQRPATAKALADALNGIARTLAA